jgi:hypothetical protein
MSQNLPDWFVDKYNEEVTLRSQQMKTALAGNVENGGVFTGDHAYFPRMGQIDAIDAARLQILAATSPPLDWIPVQCKPKFLPVVVWDPDLNKLNIPVTQQFARGVVGGIARARDKMVASAIASAVATGVQGVRGTSAEATAPAAAENIQTIGDYNTVADLDTIAQGLAVLGGNYALEGESVTFASSFKVKTNMSLDPYMANSNIRSGVLPWDDINFTTYEKLPGDGADGLMNTGVDCFLYAKSAVVEAYNDEYVPINERLGAVLADMFGAWFQGGAWCGSPRASSASSPSRTSPWPASRSRSPTRGRSRACRSLTTPFGPPRPTGGAALSVSGGPMAQSDVDVCNRSIGRVGGEPIEAWRTRPPWPPSAPRTGRRSAPGCWGNTAGCSPNRSPRWCSWRSPRPTAPCPMPTPGRRTWRARSTRPRNGQDEHGPAGPPRPAGRLHRLRHPGRLGGIHRRPRPLDLAALVRPSWPWWPSAADVARGCCAGPWPTSCSWRPSARPRWSAGRADAAGHAGGQASTRRSGAL